MHHNHLCSLLAILAPALVSAYEVPADLADGVYYAPILPASAKLRNRDAPPTYGLLQKIDGPGSEAEQATKRDDAGPSYGPLVQISAAEPSGAQAGKRDVPREDQVSDWGCAGTGSNNKISLDPASIIAAQNALKIQCVSGSIPAQDNGGVAYAIRSGVLFYACTFTGTQPCPSEEIDYAQEFVNGKCGSGYAGTMYIQDWAKGYGRQNAAIQTICEKSPEGGFLGNEYKPE